MPTLTLKQIPGFADISNANFAAEKFAIGLNFQRTIDNAKFGIVRPEMFHGSYSNGQTVPIPTSTVDGYTYQRSELTYLYHFDMTGGTSTANNGAPTSPGAIRYMNALVDQTTGVVTTNVEYLVGNGSAPVVTNDGVLSVFTIATRRSSSLVVAAQPVYQPVLDTELTEDAAVTESLMQRINTNAKAAALRSEILYLGEYVHGQAVPAPISPVDGYVYDLATEVTFQYSWRWTTQGNSLTDPVDPNYKQIQDLACDVNIAPGSPATANVAILVTYYNSRYYPSNNGRITLFAFCSRNIPNTLGAGTVDFTDMSVDFMASGRPDRFDVMDVQVRNTRYSMLRPEFFVQNNYTHGQTVALPVSPIDGYQYSREECSYVYEYSNTGPGGASSIRMSNWFASVDQGTGLVTSTIIRVQNGGGLVTTHDGWIRVVTIARRDHINTSGAVYAYTGAGNGGSDFTALQNPGFDNWYATTDQAALSWELNQQTGAGYGAQAPGLVGTFAQRLGVTAGAAPAQTASGVYPAAHSVSVLSSPVTTSAGTLYFLSWLEQANMMLVDGRTLTIRLYDAVGDTCFFVIAGDALALNNGQPSAIPATLSQQAFWFQIPNKDDTTVTTSSNGGSVGIVGLCDFTPTSMRVEFYYDGAIGTYLDLDEVTLINQIDPSIGQVASRGSSSLAFFPAISFTVTDTEFTPDLNFSIQRADGTVTPMNGGTPTISGLTQSTAFAWYPFYNEVLKIIQNIGGDSGSPAWLHSAATQATYAQWYSQSYLPFAAAPITVTTLATPSGGGTAPPSGGSGGGGTGSGGYGGGTGRGYNPVLGDEPD